MIFTIALLHTLPPIIGALIYKEKGLVNGVIIGVICAFIFGALKFTIPDLFGVAFGYFVGKCILEKK